MTAVLVLLALVVLAGAAVAMALRDLIHSALCLVLAWTGIALFYLWAGAEFLAFAQVLIYVGAVSMVVLFAVLLTRRGPGAEQNGGAAGRIAAGVITGVLAAGVLGHAILHAGLAAAPAAAPVPALTVRRLGGLLMETHAGALLVAGAILTVALIGAVVIAATDSAPGREDRR